jgi:hypothetical protein
MFLGLIVILGTLGIVNGLWSKNLVIEGVVETGDLNADWDCGWTNDDGQSGPAGVIPGGGCPTDTSEPGVDNGLDPDNYNWPDFNDIAHPLKNVGRCTLDINPEDTDYGNQVATVLIENAYPSYECTVTLLLTNTGSIPFNIIGAVLTIPQGSPLETVDEGDVDRCNTNPAEPIQVDPGQEQEFSCTVHVAQTAAQSSGCENDEWDDDLVDGQPGFALAADFLCTTTVTYSFDIEVCVAQWNEDPSTGDQADDFAACKASLQHEGPGGPDDDGDGVPDNQDQCPTLDEDPGGDDEAAPDGCPDILYLPNLDVSTVKVSG